MGMGLFVGSQSGRNSMRPNPYAKDASMFMQCEQVSQKNVDAVM
jgi:hypothetical protein